MSNRRTQHKQQFPSKPKYVELNINILGDRFAASTDHGNRNRLKDFKVLLQANRFQVEKAQEASVVSENAKNVNIKLKTTQYGKGRFFERLRRAWCSSICRRGDSFWLESAETSSTFKYKSGGTRQILQATSFSFGSLFDRGTYIKHWSSDQNTSLIQDGTIQSEFEHDTKKMAITFCKEGFLEGFREVRIDMEYRQFENYVVIDEDISNGTIHFYFSLQWPPKVFEEVLTSNGYTNYDRLTNFLGCSREVLGCSSVLCLSFPLQTHIKEQDEAGSPLGLMADLSSRGNLWLVVKLIKEMYSSDTNTNTKDDTPIQKDYISHEMDLLLSKNKMPLDCIFRLM
ncbi:hypothetical protein OS493_029749 [Desmophyllum pertusum]|uniref:PH-like domain-containing protein n=1 Tax=Desmophyllum pertusum TaxID=174260 RepID=A0A9W9Z989_9CNID|nr:hypothetical protein OS493_029749 [Desmophyllum pertusum]